MSNCTISSVANTTRPLVKGTYFGWVHTGSHIIKNPGLDVDLDTVHEPAGGRKQHAKVVIGGWLMDLLVEVTARKSSNVRAAMYEQH